MANDAQYLVFCDNCNGEIKAEKEDVIIECECGGRYAVTISQIE